MMPLEITPFVPLILRGILKERTLTLRRYGRRESSSWGDEEIPNF